MSFLDHQLYIERIDTHIDPRDAQKNAIITHGHADHARFGHTNVWATPDTIAIMKARYGENSAENFFPLEYGELIEIGGVEISLYPAGHVLGSAQVLLEYKGERIVVTGDYKRYPDKTCAPFELVKCDILVTEATFGLPVFQHPDPMDEIAKLLKSVKAQPDRAHVIGAYSLGKAQRVISLLRQSGWDAPVYLHGAIIKLYDLYEKLGVPLGPYEKATIHGQDKARFKGQIVIAPPSAIQDKWARRLPDPVVCMASGWMAVKQRARQRGVELPLIISDHADWNELIDTITETECKKVLVTHGREDALVYYAQNILGIEAQALSLYGLGEEEMD